MIGTILYELLMLLLAVAILIHAAYAVHKLVRARTSQKNPEWIGAIVWLAIAIYVLTLWPSSPYPPLYPRSSFFFFAAASIFMIEIIQKRSRYSRSAVSAVGFTIACLGLIYSVLRFLLFIRPTILTSDFFFYVCTARDMQAGFADLSLARYFYFPGIYRFWQIVLLLTDGGLDALQWSYAAILVVNSLLIAGITWRTIRNIFASVLAAVWYIVICSRFQGALGLAEPIATVPILTGLLIWGGKPFTAAGGLIRLIALGTGLGLAVYTRQQAGLVSLGALSLVFTYLVQKNDPVVRFKHLVLLPIVSAVVLLIGILVEGHGLQPFFLGLLQIPEYGMTTINMADRLWNLGVRAPMLTLLSLIAFAVWLACAVLKKLRPLMSAPWYQLLGFCCIGGFLSLASLVARPALHYGLFAGALFIIASSILIVVLIRSVPEIYKGPAFYFLLTLVTLLPFVRTDSTTAFYAWPFNEKLVRPVRQTHWPQRPGPASDLQLMKKHIEPLELVYVLPPSQNELHFFLQTRFTSYGYFSPRPLAEVLKTPGLSGVIVLSRKELNPFYARLGDKRFEYDVSERILTNHNYEPVVKLSSMVLWRKPFRAIQK